MIRKVWTIAVTTFAALCVVAAAFGVAVSSHKVKLERDVVYYDSVNDAGDGGNFWFSYHIPLRDKKGNLTGKQVLCLVYKDHTKDGTMGGSSCDWDNKTPYTGG